jgi:dTDP-4-dehydrorhamnose reductase
MVGGDMSVRRKLALVGSKGMLAAAVRSCAGPEWEIAELDLPEFDMTDFSLAESVLGELSPGVIINCAAYTNVDGAEAEASLAMRVNGEGPGNLAHIARQLDATLVHISTDYVFNGKKGFPYQEDDVVAPMSAYGRSKLAGERAIVESGLKNFYIVRTSWLYGPNGKNFVETIIRLAKEREELRIVADQVGSPTYTVDLARAIFNLLAAMPHPSHVTPHAPYGIYHYANEGQCSWYEFACAIISVTKNLGLPIKIRNVLPIKTEEYPLPAQRPAYSVFSKDKYRLATKAVVPDWQTSLKRYLQERSP